MDNDDPAKPYAPTGAILDLFYAKDKEILVEGPSGTGKSLGVCNKIHLLMMKYPNARGLILRKTRKSLTETTLVTLEKMVFQKGLFPDLSVNRSLRQKYNYPNGSELVIGGLDDPTKVMSSEYSVIFIEEATEVTETDWEMCLSRLRDFKLPYQQLIACVNPTYPTHWLNQRANLGLTKRIITRHTDNPAYYDQKTKEMTANGRDYIEGTLGKLTGIRRQRLLDGYWCMAEGRIYDTYDPSIHMVHMDVKKDHFKEYFASMDFGFAHSTVLQVWGYDEDRRMYLVYEIYRTEQTMDWWIQEARKAATIFGFNRFVCDSARPDHIDLMKKKGLNAISAYKSVDIGIQAVQERLRVQSDGKPRLFLFDDCLVGRDEKLVEKKKPWCTAQEFDSYIMDGDKPLKDNDDGMDAMRYAVAYADKLGTGSVIIASKGA